MNGKIKALLSLAAKRLDKMVAFYSKVFQIRLKTIKLGKGRLHVGTWGRQELRAVWRGP